MIRKYLLAKIGKPLKDAGLGHAPQVIHQLLHKQEKSDVAASLHIVANFLERNKLDLFMNAVVFAFIEHVGTFDTLGLMFFVSRIAKKIQPQSNCKGVTNNASTGKQKKEAH